MLHGWKKLAPALLVAGCISLVYVTPAFGRDSGGGHDGNSLWVWTQDSKRATQTRTSSGKPRVVCTWRRKILEEDVVWRDGQWFYRDIPMGQQPDETHQPFARTCNDGTSQGAGWLIPPSSVGRAIQTGVQSAARESIALPTNAVRAHPAKTLVGLESWFWIEGNQDFDRTGQHIFINVDGEPVTIALSPTKATWKFGDKSVLHAGDLGQPPPQKSTITHTYSRPGKKKVTVTFSYRAQFLYQGVWRSLLPIDRVITLDYSVQDVRAQLTRKD